MMELCDALTPSLAPQAQKVEQRPVKPKDLGSSPRGSVISIQQMGRRIIKDKNPRSSVDRATDF